MLISHCIKNIALVILGNNFVTQEFPVCLDWAKEISSEYT